MSKNIGHKQLELVGHLVNEGRMNFDQLAKASHTNTAALDTQLNALIKTYHAVTVVDGDDEALYVATDVGRRLFLSGVTRGNRRQES